MRHHISMILLSLAISAVALTANAAPAIPQVTFTADQLKVISKDTTQATGNVVIKMGATEIRTDKAKIVTEKHKVTVYTDTFIASAKK
ncbi:hypothetical protein GW643_17205 [Serratia marcescens]|uniref:LptA/OstA family protein n=1 Tax=Serratia marcescens TaxID=615 RepID=UPI001377F386|nr:LptA/OstA family protein [Serratia marcescens]MBH3035816.1 hypothetical protein [Serratia marcescens]MBH3063807.1 hypothetical protein [Serratia marcescens]NCJ12110.1 hypothetical protein [Serratia marcescens]NDJ04666.1 hypothetical protein [Serratia marcescens]